MGRWIETMSAEERDALNRRSVDESEREHSAFQEAFRTGGCYLCNQQLADFDSKRPCVHWLLRPQGVKKWHVAEVLAQQGAMASQTYLRWVASEEAKFVNINDLPSDEGEPKLIEVSIRYRDLEWSFSCGLSDLQGHGTGHSAFPHFHFQMRIAGRPFINYNDFHLPLKRSESAFLHARRSSSVLVNKFPGGSGMADVLTEENLETIVNMPVSAGEDETAPFHLGTILKAAPGTQISGSALADLIERSRREGRTFASLARELPSVTVTTHVSAGPGVVEVAERQGGRRKRRGPAAPSE